MTPSKKIKNENEPPDRRAACLARANTAQSEGVWSSRALGFKLAQLRAQLSLPKSLFLFVSYALVVTAVQWVAYAIRFEFVIPRDEKIILWNSLLWIVPLQIVLLFIFGQFRSLLGYFSLPDARRIAFSFACGCAFILLVWGLRHGRSAPPRSIILLDFLLNTIGVLCVRLLFRIGRERQRKITRSGGAVRRMIIVGAGDVGAHLAKEMRLRRDLRMEPVAFLDDNEKKWNTYLHGVPILGSPESLSELGIAVADEAVIAMPSATGKRIREVVTLLREQGVQAEIVPSFEQMVNGQVKVSNLRPVEIEDLLGRQRVNLETNRIRELISGKVVMVTGAGGSIGSELCRQIARCDPLRLLLVDQSEPNLFTIEQEMLAAGMGALVQALVADILDEERMNYIFARFRPQVVFHAAAHKHVYLMERQPCEAIRNNSYGTRILAKLAATHLVGWFIMISTDKAINPTSIMGVSKRLAEIHLQALQSSVGEQTKFITVRFGNVLGSSGSVVPIFKKQISAGGPITVTHPDVTRYFMTIPEAAGLVLQASVLGKGGEIFVLDMGQPVKILDLARQMIELSGLVLGEDIEIKFTGLKPGEKLYEELQHANERFVTTEHTRIMRFLPGDDPTQASQLAITTIEARLYLESDNELRRLLKNIVPEYTPFFD